MSKNTKLIKAMTINPFQQLACPLDGLPLSRDGKTWRCESRHSYDIAKQGHTHLLPVQNTRSRNPGDSKEMIDARQRFLDTGLYKPVADALRKTVFDDLSNSAAILDAGCGEGYYLRELISEAKSEQNLDVMGLDISKPAILSAARQNKSINWVIASNANIPVLENTIDRVICMFGFPVYSEFSRVLKQEGQLIMIESGPNHLQELREIIYPVVKPQKEKQANHEGFRLISTESLCFTIELNKRAIIADLLTMTPHLFRASAEGKKKASQLESLSLTVDVRVLRMNLHGIHN